MLNLLLGTSGSGKSTRLMQTLRAEAQAGRRSILIVPEQFTSSTEGALYRLLGDSKGPHRILGFGRAYHQFAVDAVDLLGDGNGPIFYVQVRPEQGQQLATPQAGGQFQIERRQKATFVRLHEIGADLLLGENLHLLFLQFGQFAAL